MVVLVPWATTYLADWLLLIGVVALSVATIVFKRNLARVGYDAVLVHLSQFKQITAFLIMVMALAMHTIAFFGITIFAVRLELDINLVRTLAAFGLIAFLPVTVVVSAKLSKP